MRSLCCRLSSRHISRPTLNKRNQIYYGPRNYLTLDQDFGSSRDSICARLSQGNDTAERVVSAIILKIQNGNDIVFFQFFPFSLPDFPRMQGWDEILQEKAPPLIGVALE